ncbi:AVAST type 4 anti-phage nuclease Avs4 [Pinibacter aurantiacus]|uniref:ATP-binding protein n=1 Tax=Pinibacter aurantiacus TaxID=2851599 RepID=A0A9E2S9Y8_9BACT|nr:AVAST type 4 anti-phage nuclease Avs4 [Pinibacter aurantiacus]MBV4357359.1 ATP-binding protein [Pinibacter aurantiacus]
MTALNWNIFRTKFHQRERDAFESLAYMLFCYEHNIKIGIFRFKNQTGIETEPIEHNGQKIGFQAKFYDIKLSDNKDDIIQSLRKAKEKNPLLNKMLIYTNQELSEGRDKHQKKPSYLKTIEEVAIEVQLEIEWRVNSHFEKQLSVPENAYLFNWYFGAEKNIVDFLEQLTKHSEVILFPIHTSIHYGDRQLKIDRSSLVSKILSSPSKVIILSGDGGSGKTALVKEMWSRLRPIYVLKASEFNRPSISHLLKDFGEFGLVDFVAAHSEEVDRTFIIDSAEKLADLENQDVFIEFLSTLISNEWKIIFTTRNSFLDDLRFQMLEIYRLTFQTIVIENLTPSELRKLAEEFRFTTPKDAKVFSLIQNLFYLQEYLDHFNNTSNDLDYGDFRELLWQKRIQKSKIKKNNIHLEREKCFLEIAKRRCNTGDFFLTDLPCSGDILALLSSDEIIQYDDSQKGYFITHDIYEEWALQRLIENQFAKFTDFAVFFDTIGEALPMRRAFRSWLSDKLLQEDPGLRVFVENSFIDDKIPPFWKDELLISILLSECSTWFFETFESIILENDQYYLKSIVFLLRTACKEVDEIWEKINQVNVAQSGVFFTKPKGKGWEATIEFLYKHIAVISGEDLGIILPLLKDWNNQHSSGTITRLAGLFALHFYKDSELNESMGYPSTIEEQLLLIVLAAARELKTELTELGETLLQVPYSRRTVFNSLRNKILIDNNASIYFIYELPELTIRLLDQAWHKPQDEPTALGGGMNIDKYYAIRSHDYYPPSAYQTPVFSLLQADFSQTVQFILDFNNRSTLAYEESKYGNTLEVVELEVDGVIVKQLISQSLWCMHRGSSSPVTPYLLQSMHMALEKKLMSIAANSDGKNLVQWLKYLLKETRSASITAVVASVVLAYPEKLFEIALILFHQYLFFVYDNQRLIRENEVESIYSFWRGMDPHTKKFEDERIASCKEPHRRKTLESLVLESQFFRTGDVSQVQADRHKRAILDIIDKMYAATDGQDSKSEKYKVFRIFLARIDSRKMSPKVEHRDGKAFILFNPELANDLQQFSDEGAQQHAEMLKFRLLKTWGLDKFRNRHASGTYEQYEMHPRKVVEETKLFIEELKQGKNDFRLFDNCIPAFTCAALLKQYHKELSKKDLKFCRDVIMEFAVQPIEEGYEYQISDGVEAAISAIPYLYTLFPKDKNLYNFILLVILFDTYRIGEYKRVCDYSTEAINSILFHTEPKEANAILSCYLKFKPLLDDVTDPRKLYFENTTRIQALHQFIDRMEQDIGEALTDESLYYQIDFDALTITDFEMVFKSFPDGTKDPLHLEFIKKALEKFRNKLLLNDRCGNDDDDIDEGIEYRVKCRFIRKYARFLLWREANTVAEWVTPFISPFNVSNYMAMFISDVVLEQDRLQKYEQFWEIWQTLYQPIKQASLGSEGHHLDSIIHNYLLAWGYWQETAKEWHTLKSGDSVFFKKICGEMGAHKEVLYSIARLLNEIGSSYLNEGVYWVADMIVNNKKYVNEDIHPNTIYYLNQIARKFIYLNRTKIKSNRMLRSRILIVLNFLFGQGSVTGYLLREEVF